MQRLIRKAEEKQESGGVLAGRMFFSALHAPSVSVKAAMMHLLHTLYIQLSQIPQSLMTLYRKCSKAGRSETPDVSAIMLVLAEILKDAPQTCIFIDAIDECKDVRVLGHILSRVEQLQSETGVGVVFTDRAPGTLCRTAFSQLTRKRLSADDLDMRAYIRKFINNTSFSADLDLALVDRAVDTICRASAGKYEVHPASISA